MHCEECGREQDNCQTCKVHFGKLVRSESVRIGNATQIKKYYRYLGETQLYICDQCIAARIKQLGLIAIGGGLAGLFLTLIFAMPLFMPNNAMDRWYPYVVGGMAIFSVAMLWYGFTARRQPLKWESLTKQICEQMGMKAAPQTPRLHYQRHELGADAFWSQGVYEGLKPTLLS